VDELEETAAEERCLAVICGQVIALDELTLVAQPATTTPHMALATTM